MQKFIATYLIFIILFQSVFVTTNFLFEINELAQDFSLHQLKYGDNLTSFISKHFGELKEAHQQQHKEEHQQHKHPSNEINNVDTTNFTVYSCDFTPKNTLENYTLKPNFYYQDKFSTFEKQKIFQPPKVA